MGAGDGSGIATVKAMDAKAARLKNSFIFDDDCLRNRIDIGIERGTVALYAHPPRGTCDLLAYDIPQSVGLARLRPEQAALRQPQILPKRVAPLPPRV